MKFSILCKGFILLTSFLLLSTASAQVGIGTILPEESSILELKSTNRGFLPPRMTTSERDDINGGIFAEGLIIFNEDINCIEFYNGDDWISLCNSVSETPPPNLPANITLTADKVVYIASVYDNNYTPYVAATAVAATGPLAPTVNNGPETLVNIQGVLTTTGRTVKIPYSVSSGFVDLVAFSQTRTVISSHIQGPDLNSNDSGGTPVDVTFSYPAQTNLTGSGTITATIKAVNTDLNAVKLDINAGIGTDLGIVLAEFSIALDNNGNVGPIKLKDIPGIPDRMMGQTDNTGNNDNHNFLYLPLVSTTSGQTWLNHNLGSATSSINKASDYGTGCTFNFTQDASSKTDHCSYGSLFQWGRKADGHELMKHVSATSATPINAGLTTTKASTNSPNHTSFIYTEIDWFENPVENLWNGVDAINAICPDGFRLPTSAELTLERDSWPWTGTFNAPTPDDAFNAMKITSVGYRDYLDGNVKFTGNWGYYWGSELDFINYNNGNYPGYYASGLAITSHANAVVSVVNSRGRGVRCIQD